MRELEAGTHSLGFYVKDKRYSFLIKKSESGDLQYFKNFPKEFLNLDFVNEDGIKISKILSLILELNNLGFSLDKPIKFDNLMDLPDLSIKENLTNFINKLNKRGNITC
ncbi:MAG: hypothetical protein COA71_14555 [SAR86 cluster bacterium]|uniref:Uncharacterized protein n=1 Tax=SAR86 cluster bacterium TaxID=2030880 RepID=A0A2A5C5J4_9GAMM|nr:MAG: hypothetical protein COA71_14555 [SAR86 cluster bacterium]